MNEMRIWKWMLPCVLVPVFFVAALIMRSVGSEFADYCAGGFVMLMPIFGVQAWAGFRAYYAEVETVQLETRRRALADTAEVRLFEASRHMHPQTVELLLKHRREVWRIREMGADELYTLVLDADPRINHHFLEYVLVHSNFYSIMPKRMLNDKAKTFDPMKVVTDYEMYDALHALLERRGWLTAGFGNQPGAWIEPWNPELVGRRFGVTFDEEVAEVEEQPSAVGV